MLQRYRSVITTEKINEFSINTKKNIHKTGVIKSYAKHFHICNVHALNLAVCNVGFMCYNSKK